MMAQLSKARLSQEQYESSSNGVFSDYIINVKTSNRFGAGTDANIYIQLCGGRGYSEPMLLKNSQNVNKFERNQFDQFLFRDEVNRGELKSIKVWHDNSGIGASWHLEYIEVSDIENGLKYRFPCHRWFSTTEDDGKISRELKCMEITAGPKQAVQRAAGTPKTSITAMPMPIYPVTPMIPIIPKQEVLVNSVKKLSTSSQKSLSSSLSNSVYGPYSQTNAKQDPTLNVSRPKATNGSPYGRYSNR